MPSLRAPIAVAAAACGLLAQAAPAAAAQLATWVSASGKDASTCAITAPCKTFKYAFTQTTTGGVISVLDAGSFGPVSITHSVSIIASGAEAIVATAVSCPGGGKAGICISGSHSVVELRGLTIDLGKASSTAGIRFNAGTALEVRNSLVRNAAGPGIDFVPPHASGLTVADTRVAGNTTAGIVVAPTSSGRYVVSLANVHAESNGDGFLFSGASSIGLLRAVVRDSVFSHNARTGISVIEGGSGIASAMIEGSALVNNGGTGLFASGTNALALIGNSTISANAVGFDPQNGANIDSFSTNELNGNINADGAASVNLLLQ
jgi:hypothetical protein